MRQFFLGGCRKPQDFEQICCDTCSATRVVRQGSPHTCATALLAPIAAWSGIRRVGDQQVVSHICFYKSHTTHNSLLHHSCSVFFVCCQFCCLWLSKKYGLVLSKARRAFPRFFFDLVLFAVFIFFLGTAGTEVPKTGTQVGKAGTWAPEPVVKKEKQVKR